MKKRFSGNLNWHMALCICLVVVSLVVTSCSTSKSTTIATTTTTSKAQTTTTTTTTAPSITTTTTATTTTSTTVVSTVLTVNNEETTKTYTLAELKALQSATGYGATKNKTGIITQRNSYVGVTLTSLIKAAGGMTNAATVRITGADGEMVLLNWSQIYQGTFNIYDKNGNSAQAGVQPIVSLVYSMDGNDLDAATGPVEMGIMTAGDQVSDASMWLKQTIKIEVLPAVTLNISAASSLSNVLTAINTLYAQTNPNVTFSTNFAASGTLQTQIENGAPADVFISAATAQMDNLQNGSLLVDTTRKNLLNNKLVMIVPNNSTLGLTSFSDMTLAKVTKIAIGDPKSVPAGTYAQAAFDKLGITAQIQSKFVLAANVTQVLTYVASGNVDVGFVYSTDALSSKQVKVVVQAPADINALIVYPAAVLKSSKDTFAAKAYLNFLFSDQAKVLFIQYGFTMAGN
jgi:molybdate transport system substrate-binding protein